MANGAVAIGETTSAAKLAIKQTFTKLNWIGAVRLAPIPIARLANAAAAIHRTSISFMREALTKAVIAPATSAIEMIVSTKESVCA